MPAIGADSRAHIRKVYTIAAAIAGIAGAVLAQTTQTVSLESISFERSADVLVMLVLGGAGPALWRPGRRSDLHGRARPVLRHCTAILVFLDRCPAGDGRHVASERHARRLVAHLRALGAEMSDAMRVSTTCAVEELRLAGGRARHRVQSAERRALRADRSERRRQDHAHQPDDRNAGAQCRADLARER